VLSCGVLRLTTSLICLLSVACATTLLRGTPKGPEETYAVAMEDLDDGLYPEAISGFTEVKTKYPYSKFAALSDLRIADTHFARAKYIEAIDAYRAFLKYHPSHAEAAYAMFKIGDAYFEQIPSDWWFLPPSAEKDQASTRLAISAYRDLLARYPDRSQTEKGKEQIEACKATVEKHEKTGVAEDGLEKCRTLARRQELVNEGVSRLNKCRRKLADHEIYVARFYFKRDQFKSAAGRAEGLLRDYGGLGLDAEALWLSARARMQLVEPEIARVALTRLTTEFPDSSEADDAAELLNGMGPAPVPPSTGEPRGN
jgi:outer membrane protein assembly factor BamD